MPYSQKFYKLKKEAEDLATVGKPAPTTPSASGNGTKITKTPGTKSTGTGRKRKNAADGVEPTPTKRGKKVPVTSERDLDDEDEEGIVKQETGAFNGDGKVKQEHAEDGNGTEEIDPEDGDIA